MPIEIPIPRLGWNMDEGTFAGWLKRDGEPVRAGEPLFNLEGEKATQEIEATDAGILRIAPTAPAIGDRVPVGAVIGYLLQPGEPDPIDLPAAAVQDETFSHTAPTVPASATVLPAARAANNRPCISPLARRIARELGIDWTELEGSGCTGRIRKVDILAAAQARTDAPRSTPPRDAPRPLSVTLSPTRKIIAARMVQSRQTTAAVTLTTTVDATNLVQLRRQFQTLDPEGRDVPGYTDFVVKLAALALRDHPRLNSRLENDQIVTPAEIHIGIAVDTDAGLLVPVLRDVLILGLRPLADRARDLIRRARAQTLTPGEMQGGTFTVTNLGAFGIETFTPIINPPECAILGLGRIARQPVMEGDRVVGRERMGLSLTFDHRLVDAPPQPGSSSGSGP